MSLSLSGKTAIVTGAANGIGLAIARHFVEKGANVMFADMDEARLVAEVGDAARKEEAVRYFAGDLREKLAIANLLSATVDAFDRIDVVVNAVRQVMPSDPLSAEADNVADMLEQNMFTSLRVSQMAARRMIAIAEREGVLDGQVGAIVNITSIAARVTRPELLGYSISCAALEQMTRSLAVALAPERIRVNAVAFGSVMSASLKAALKEKPEMRDAIVEGTPMGRIAAPGELAEAVQFLASDAAAFVTGHVLTVDGGRSLVDAVRAAAH